MTSLVSSLKRKLASILPFSGTVNEPRSLQEVVDGSPSSSLATDYHRLPKRQRSSLLQTDSDDNDGDSQSQSNDAHLLRQSSSWFTITPPLVQESLPPIRGNQADTDATPNNGSIIDDLANDHHGSLISQQQPSALLRLLPHDTLSYCLSYLNTPSDRFGLQVTSTVFRELSNGEAMLAKLELGGDHNSSSSSFRAGVVSGYAPSNEEGDALPPAPDASEAEGLEGNNGVLRRPPRANMASSPTALPPLASARGGGGIILDVDTSVVACEKLIKFAAAGNMQAIYMIAMILCYCHENISEGIALLRHAAESFTHLPSVYALALILRDTRPIESDRYLDLAASLGHAPAWQEKLTAAEMRARFGDLDADNLVKYLDPPCLNRLLGRHYLGSQRVRKCQTSHCWNPLCGRWAYKALRAEAGRQQQRGNGARQLMAMFNARLNDLAAANGNDDGRVQLHDVLEPVNANDTINGGVHPFGEAADISEGRQCQPCLEIPIFSIESLLLKWPGAKATATTTLFKADSSSELPSPLEQLRQALQNKPRSGGHGLKVSRMKMCSSCRRAKYCSKLCQVYDWRSGRHKMECQFL